MIKENFLFSDLVINDNKNYIHFTALNQSPADASFEEPFNNNAKSLVACSPIQTLVYVKHQNFLTKPIKIQLRIGYSSNVMISSLNCLVITQLILNVD